MNRPASHEQAIAFYRRAASIAQRIYANNEAIRLYQHLLQGGLEEPVRSRNLCGDAGVGRSLASERAVGRGAAINREALEMAETSGDVALQAQAQRALADVLRLLGHYDSALEWLSKAEFGFETIGNWRGVVSALWTMGEVYWFKSDHKRALAALERQLQSPPRSMTERGICEALDTMGMVYWSQGDWDQSMDCCLRSIAIAEPLGYHLVITRAAITWGTSTPPSTQPTMPSAGTYVPAVSPSDR